MITNLQSNTIVHVRVNQVLEGGAEAILSFMREFLSQVTIY